MQRHQFRKAHDPGIVSRSDAQGPARPEAVYFYGTCLVALFFPEVGLSGMRLLQREGVRVIYPQGQTCMITGRRGPAEKDGPAEVHLMILDNGRSRIYSDEELSATLKCIRCGACMNHCPVYTRVGGHAYGAVYPGPIGKILIPQTEGVARRHDLVHTSNLCGACVEACPVETSTEFPRRGVERGAERLFKRL